MQNNKHLLINILTNMMNNKTVIFHIVIASLIISYTFYSRLLVTRLPKSLIVFDEYTIKYFLLTFILLSFFLSSLLLIITIIRFFSHKNTSNFITTFISKINDFIADALFDFYNLILKVIPKSYEKLSGIASKFYALFHKESESLFVFLLFIIRFIIAIAFLVDVFVFFKLEYMYKLLYLLCFSILIKTFFYMLRDLSGNFEEIKSYLIITEEGYDTETNLPITTYALKEEYKELDLQYYASQYILISKIKGYLEMYDKYTLFFAPYFNIIIYSLYTIGWFYVILCNVIF